MSELDLQHFWDEASYELPDWAQDHQARSRRTRESVLFAARRLIESESWESVSMQDVARESDASIGALYARFPSKDTVLQLLATAVFHGASRAFRESFAKSGSSLADKTEAYVSTLVDQLTLHRRVIQESRTTAATLPALRTLMDRFNHTIHQSFLSAVRETSEGSQISDEQFRMVLFTVNAAAREAIIAGALRTYQLDLTGTDLKEWLLQVALRGFLD